MESAASVQTGASVAATVVVIAKTAASAATSAYGSHASAPRAPQRQAYDPLFDKPYEVSERAEAPSWEKGGAQAPRSGLSANIKPKKKVAALFGAKKPPVTADSES